MSRKEVNMKEKLIKPVKMIAKNLPIMIGIILLIGIIEEFVTFESIAGFFTGNTFLDTFIGSFMGSIFAGNSMNSYIIARELQSVGISLFAITAFLVSWVTVGLLQAPIEAQIFGRAFAIKRNLYSAVLAVFVSIVTVTLWGVL